MFRAQVFATQDPSKGYKGISCFVVEKGMGVEIAKKEKKVRPLALELTWVTYPELTVHLARAARYPCFIDVYPQL